MSRELLVEAYVSALPFAAVAIVQTAGGGCRIETAAPGEVARYYFKPSHVDLVLGAAGLADGPIDHPLAFGACEQAAQRAAIQDCSE